MVREELNVANIDEVFSEFSPTPLGTASLAQVHKARLRSNGEVVAVKVQHPTVRSNSEQDMARMESALALVASL